MMCTGSSLLQAYRTLQVSVPCSAGHSWSKREHLVQGAPQGSLWRPSVWRTYMRPLIRRLREVFALCGADAATLFFADDGTPVIIFVPTKEGIDGVERVG